MAELQDQVLDAVREMDRIQREAWGFIEGQGVRAARHVYRGEPGTLIDVRDRQDAAEPTEDAERFGEIAFRVRTLIEDLKMNPKMDAREIVAALEMIAEEIEPR